MMTTIPDWRDKSVVSNALVAVGTYSLNGIADTKVRPDPAARAGDVQLRGDDILATPPPNIISRGCYLDGVGGDKDSRQGLRWLYLAADKGNVQAQGCSAR